jgi:flagellar biosynthetic protein FliR
MSLPDFGFGNIEAELWRLIFVMARIGAALVAAPIFGAMSVPVQLRIVLAGAMAVFVLAWTPVATPPALLSLAGLLALAGEVVLGLAFGFVLQLSFAVPILAAEQIGGTMGFAIATAVDPNTGSQSGALGQYFTLVLTLIFLGVGGHLLWLRLIVESYAALPPDGNWLAAERIWLLVGFAGEMFATAVAIALPVTLALLLVQLVTGVLSRSAPALNLFSLGLPAGVLAGIAALLAAAPLVTEQFVTLSAAAISQAGSLAQP